LDQISTEGAVVSGNEPATMWSAIIPPAAFLAILLIGIAIADKGDHVNMRGFPIAISMLGGWLVQLFVTAWVIVVEYDRPKTNGYRVGMWINAALLAGILLVIVM
jgi:hypothetical protein